MILIDSRESKDKKGSPGLWDDFKKTKLPVSKAKLEFGDLMFLGNGPEGKEVSVGVEFKKHRDFFSSLRTGRLVGHQLSGMAESYDFRYLLIEGDWKVDSGGLVCVRTGFSDWSAVQGKLSSSEVDKTLIGLPLRLGVHVWTTSTRKDTMRWLTNLYRCWTDKKWKDHGSHIAIYQPPTLVPISNFRKTVATFPGIGVKTSQAVEKHFRGSIHKAVTAPIHEWGKIEGIGLKTAESICTYLKGK